MAAFTQRVKNENWESFDIDVALPYLYSGPTDVAISYIKNNDLYLAFAPVDSYYNIYSSAYLGRALSCSIAYDARWRASLTSIAYEYYTIGEPYIAYVDTSNRLYVQQGVSGSKFKLDYNVTYCFIVRGWKNISIKENDQGLIVFYIKNGKLYSRAYVETNDGSFVWESAVCYKEAGNSIVKVTANRTSDYRIMIVVYSNKGNKLLFTDRTWPGTAIPAEVVSCFMYSDTSYNYKQLQIISSEYTDYVKFNMSYSTNSLITRTHTNVLNVYNTDDGLEIHFLVETLPSQESVNNNLEALIITDADNKVYNVYSILCDTLHNELIATVKNISNVTSSLHYEYKSGWLTSDKSIAYKAFSGNFTPTNLTPIEPEPPLLVSISNVDTEVYDNESN